MYKIRKKVSYCPVLQCQGPLDQYKTAAKPIDHCRWFICSHFKLTKSIFTVILHFLFHFSAKFNYACITKATKHDELGSFELGSSLN